MVCVWGGRGWGGNPMWKIFKNSSKSVGLVVPKRHRPTRPKDPANKTHLKTLLTREDSIAFENTNQHGGGGWMVDWRRLLYCLSPYIPPPIIPIVLPRVVFVAKAWAGSPLITLLPALTTRTASLSNQLYCALSFICGRPTLSREPFTPLLLRILSISKQENCRNHVSSFFFVPQSQVVLGACVCPTWKTQKITKSGPI